MYRYRYYTTIPFPALPLNGIDLEQCIGIQRFSEPQEIQPLNILAYGYIDCKHPISNEKLALIPYLYVNANFLCINQHIFKIVNYFPDSDSSYTLWNIGEHMPDGYLPFCQLAAVQPYPGGCCINSNTLLAVACPEAQMILDVASHTGAFTISEFEEYIANPDKQKNKAKIKLAENALAALLNLKSQLQRGENE